MALDLGGFNRNVQAEMARNGITQGDLARSLDMHQAAVSRRLTGRTDWTLPEVTKVADLLNVPLSALLPEVAA